MSDIVVQGIVRPERAVSGPWLEVIASNLDYHRATFLWKCEGLSDAQLRLHPVRTSTLTLLGLMRHLQGVERAWFQRTLAGTTPRFPAYRTYVAADGGTWYVVRGTTSRTPRRPGTSTRTTSRRARSRDRYSPR